jgi:uroporphyrinogen III methyltransferase / synthase
MSSKLDKIRVLVLRPEHQASELAGQLKAEGASPVLVPAIRILPPADWTQIDSAVERLDSFDWIVFTSVNGADSFLSRMSTSDVLPGRVGAIGPGTRDRLIAGGIDVHWMPSSFTSAALADQLPEPPARVLLVRADIATGELDEALRARGFEVERLDAYRTESANSDQLVAALGQVDAVALTSASIARSFAAASAGYPAGLPAVCSIGPATSAACREAGLDVSVEAAEHTIPGLVRAIVGLFVSS